VIVHDGAGARPAAGRRRRLNGADNPLIRAVQRIPSGVRSKLLIALLGEVVLLVVVGFFSGARGVSVAFISSICLPTIRSRDADVPPKRVPNRQFYRLLTSVRSAPVGRGVLTTSGLA